jgi:hypothetical protein
MSPPVWKSADLLTSLGVQACVAIRIDPKVNSDVIQRTQLPAAKFRERPSGGSDDAFMTRMWENAVRRPSS